MRSHDAFFLGKAAIGRDRIQVMGMVGQDCAMAQAACINRIISVGECPGLRGPDELSIR